MKEGCSDLGLVLRKNGKKLEAGEVYEGGAIHKHGEDEIILLSLFNFSVSVQETVDPMVLHYAYR